MRSPKNNNIDDIDYESSDNDDGEYENDGWLVDDGTTRRRSRPGTVALRDIRRLQRSTELVIKRAPFQRIVRNIFQEKSKGLRMTKEALNTIQQSLEYFLIELLDKSNTASIHAKRVTTMKKDVDFIKKISNFYN